MWYVYIIRSIHDPVQEYTGVSEDLKQRIADHNVGKSTHICQVCPLGVVVVCCFSQQNDRAVI